MGPQLEAFVNRKRTMRLLRIDIGRWGSPVAEQYGIGRLPTLHLYEGTELRCEDSQQILEFLNGG